MVEGPGVEALEASAAPSHNDTLVITTEHAA